MITKEQLEEIMHKVWMRDWSADDGVDAIWGEPFEEYTELIDDGIYVYPDGSKC
jgi:hypothetical protein